MVKIASYVFFDIETTGLPHQERNKTKIIELSFIVALREDLETANIGSRPYISKLTLLLNPERKINPAVTILTGIDNKMVKNAPIFKDKYETILTFLKGLPKPVCLVAHNGNVFDYKIFLTELIDVNASLPSDLLCVDSLVGFRRMYKEKWPNNINTNFEDVKDEHWPDLNITPEDWNEIEILCSSICDVDLQESLKKKKHSSSQNNSKDNMSFKLTDIYRRLLNKEVVNAHRAEEDCMMLLECVVAAKEFLTWSDKYCKSIHDIKPLQRYC